MASLGPNCVFWPLLAEKDKADDDGDGEDDDDDDCDNKRGTCNSISACSYNHRVHIRIFLGGGAFRPT